MSASCSLVSIALIRIFPVRTCSRKCLYFRAICLVRGRSFRLTCNPNILPSPQIITFSHKSPLDQEDLLVVMRRCQSCIFLKDWCVNPFMNNSLPPPHPKLILSCLYIKEWVLDLCKNGFFSTSKALQWGASCSISRHAGSMSNNARGSVGASSTLLRKLDMSSTSRAGDNSHHQRWSLDLWLSHRGQKGSRLQAWI